MASRSDFVRAIAEALGISLAQAAEIFDAFWLHVGSLLAAGESVRLPGLGHFSIGERAPRAGRHPFTGEIISIPAAKGVRFKAAKPLKATVGVELGKRGGQPTRPRTRGADDFIADSDVGTAYDTRSPGPDLSELVEPARGGGGKVAVGPALPTSPPAATALDEAPPAPAPEPPAAEARPDREISAWITERADDGDHRPLEVDSPYHLNFRVGAPVAANLLSGDTRVGGDEVPPEGLDLQWVVHSRGVELLPGPDVEVTVEVLDGEPAWTARFALRIPERGDSEERTLDVVPRRAGDARLDVLLLRERHDPSHDRQLREVYRQLAIRLAVGLAGAAAAPGESGGPLEVVGDVTLTAGRHLNLRTPHEWVTPPGELSITVFPGAAYVMGDVFGAAGIEARNQSTPWRAKPALVEGPMENARDSAERFRARWEDYLDDVDPADLEQRLGLHFAPYDWRALADQADAHHHQAWDQVAVSAELRDLAFDGYALYQTFFPPGSELRGWLDGLPFGHRLNLTWFPLGSGDFVPHVPWGLMYRRPAPPAGTAVDPLEFLGLGFRLGYTSHEVAQPSKALGARGHNNPSFLLYYGSDPGDETAAEAAWQRKRWSGWPNGVVVPAAGAAPAAAKQELLAALDNPGPSPATLLYLYCQASVGQGNDPLLRFGTDLSGQDDVGRTDLPQRPLADRPLVFVNACTTAAAGAYKTNLLEEGFFQRGCRAFLGTETKVPIAFASRFAAAFFHFLALRVPEPLAAGEAMALARLFFWCHYRNLGGLLYSYVNQYELYLADDDELQSLRA